MSSIRLISLVGVLCGVAAAGTSELRGQAPAGVKQPAIKVTLLGTAPGPPVRVGQAGISTLVEANGERFLFDAGYGFMARLVESGLPMDAVTRLFRTHLHSDHLADLPALMLLPWSAPSARDVPLEVWGPAGTTDMVRHLEQAFAFDIHVRRDLDEKASAKGIEVIGHDIREGTVYEQTGVKITAFLVDRTRGTYTGRVETGEDLMVIEIGDEVVVRRREPAPPRR